MDALALRYGWELSSTPTHCVCGVNFTVQHVLSCPRGGFPSIRHNELRDITASLLTEVCHDVKTEPDLQPLSGEVMSHATVNTTEGARLDIAVNGFWGSRYERTYLDVRVFNPLATSNSNTSISNCYRKHENEKKRAYEQRIREVEHSTFTPLVFSATGGMGKQGTTILQEAGLPPCRQVGPTIQLHTMLATLSHFLLLYSGPPSSAYVGPAPHVVTPSRNSIPLT